MSVTSFADELSEYGDPDICVISEELGFVRGSDEVPEQSDEELGREDFVHAKRKFREQMEKSASIADVLVLLFTKNTFRTVVSSNWIELVDAAKPGTTWCIATSRKAFDTVDMDLLRDKGIEPILYERVGVARIGTETREELIDQIDS